MQICCFIYPLLFLIDDFNIIKWFLYLYLYFKNEMKATDKLIQGFATVNIVVMLSLVLYIAISGKSLSGLNIPNLVFSNKEGPEHTYCVCLSVCLSVCILVIGRVEGVRRVAGPRVPLVLTGIPPRPCQELWSSDRGGGGSGQGGVGTSK